MENSYIKQNEENLLSYYKGLKESDFISEFGLFCLKCFEGKESYFALGTIELMKQAVLTDIREGFINESENKEDREGNNL